MRIGFGLVGLLVVLAIVGLLASRQARSVLSPTSTEAVGAASVPLKGNVAEQSKQLQNQVRDDVDKLMQAAPARAEPPP